VHEQVADKLSVIFSDLGPQDVKNIPRPVHAYRVQLENGMLGQTSVANLKTKTEAVNQPSISSFVVIAALAIALGALGSYVVLNKPWSGPETAAKTEAPATLPTIATTKSEVGANPSALAKPAAQSPSSAAVSPTVPTRDFAERLTLILEKGAPKESAQSRKDSVSAFLTLASHRAMAIAPRVGRHWRTGGWPSRLVAEEKVLEKCVQFYDEPCAIIVVDDSLIEPKSDGAWATQDAPRVSYSGQFDPEKLPGLRAQQLRSPQVLSYSNAAGPKAAAFHAEGLFTISTGSDSQRGAEERALNDCNAHPDRARSGNRPCYLYAVGNRVVLPLRRTSPLTEEAQVPKDTAPSSPAPKPTSIESALLAAMQEIAPAMPQTIRAREGSFYVTSGEHKALAMHPPYDSWRRTFLPNEKAAEEVALEGCQVRHGDPCILLAVNDSLRKRSSTGEWQTRAMPRVSYSGTYDPLQIPTLKDSDRARPEVANYRSLTGPKATALHPWGLLFVATGGATQFSAESKSLSDCNEDPVRNGRDGPCWLYSVGDQVVLSKRSRFPISPKS
jgi:hypothetical protein